MIYGPIKIDTRQALIAHWQARLEEITAEHLDGRDGNLFLIRANLIRLRLNELRGQVEEQEASIVQIDFKAKERTKCASCGSAVSRGVRLCSMCNLNERFPHPVAK